MILGEIIKGHFTLLPSHILSHITSLITPTYTYTLHTHLFQPPTVNMTTTDDIRSWEIEYEVVGNVGRRIVLLVNGSATTRHALNVGKEGTQYRVRVAGLNVRGRGAWSPYMVAETLEDSK